MLGDLTYRRKGDVGEMGIVIACMIIALWAGHLVWSLLFAPLDAASPLLYIHIVIQTYLSTGLFITAHDAMHGAVARSSTVNTLIGRTCSMLYAFLSYARLRNNHVRHHSAPGTDGDPDYSTRSQLFFLWWFTFMRHYATVMQVIGMAVIYNILHIWFGDLRLWILWVLPLFASTFQLFSFGTYERHRLPHTKEMQPHNSRTLMPNHAWAMLSCYFFGYHHEHHSSPRTPWWKLHTLKRTKRPGSSAANPGH